jgi:hypothetical protein
VTTALWTLDSTRDATRLVPGSPGDVEADAADADAQAAALEALTEDATRSVVTPSWSGTAAAGWARRRDQLLPAPAAIASAYRAAASALRSHAAALTWAQQRATVAIRLWEGDPTSCSPVDTRALALAVLAEARARTAASAHALAQVLDRLGDGLPDGQFHAHAFFAGVWDWAYGVGSSLLANDPMRSAYDPVGYWRHQVEQVRGVVGLVDDPGATVGALVDTRGLDDDPGRWWGQLAPDLALTVGSVGAAGLAARSASIGSRAAVVAEQPPLVIRVLGTEPSPYVRLSTSESWANTQTLQRHLRDHGADFAVADADEYALLASTFFQRGGIEGLPTRITDAGVIRIYDPSTNTFGSFDASGQTKTLYKPSGDGLAYWSRQNGMLLP